MKEAFKAGKLEAKYIGNAGGGGGLRIGWPPVSDFASMFEAAVRTESVRNLVRAHKEAQSTDELELDAAVALAVELEAAAAAAAALAAIGRVGDEMAVELPDDDDDEPPDDDDDVDEPPDDEDEPPEDDDVDEPPDDDDVDGPPDDDNVDEDGDEAAGPALTLERLMVSRKARNEVVAAEEAAVVADLTRRMDTGIRVNPQLAKLHGVAHRAPDVGAAAAAAAAAQSPCENESERWQSHNRRCPAGERVRRQKNRGSRCAGRTRMLTGGLKVESFFNDS